jgi:hypothetical protein
MTAPYSRPWLGSADSGRGDYIRGKAISRPVSSCALPDQGVGTGRRRIPGLRDVRRTRGRMSRGLEDSRQGRVLSNEEMGRRMREWR